LSLAALPWLTQGFGVVPVQLPTSRLFRLTTGAPLAWEQDIIDRLRTGEGISGLEMSNFFEQCTLCDNYFVASLLRIHRGCACIDLQSKPRCTATTAIQRSHQHTAALLEAVGDDAKRLWDHCLRSCVSFTMLILWSSRLPLIFRAPIYTSSSPLHSRRCC
jgi:hypothetical protein